MAQLVTVKIFKGDDPDPVGEAQVEGQASFGRRAQDETDEASYKLYQPYPKKGERDQAETRFLIAETKELSISRTHVIMEPTGESRVKLTNCSRGPICLEGGIVLQKNGTYEVALPVGFAIGDRRLRLESPDEGTDSILRLDSSSLTLGHNDELAKSYAAAAIEQAQKGSLDNAAMLRWVQAILGVLRDAAGTLDFFQRAARVLVDLIGLDSGRVLLRDNKRWLVRAHHSTFHAGPPADEWQPSRSIVAEVLKGRKTCFLHPEMQTSVEHSLRNVKSVIAAPLLGRGDEVIGILYGERYGGEAGKRTIGHLEGMLVDMLACGIAAGQARVEQQEAASRARVQMEQFFTKELAQQLENNPALLEGRDVEVSLLSCDIRGFSDICDRLAARPAQTLEWLNGVLGSLSDCILDADGVLVDYVGDELMSMWGAPQPQADHARRACTVALALLDKVPDLNEQWQKVVQQPMGLRIGVSSGVARVGNVGSARKFKYGALGTTMNLASRVQGAVKQLGNSLLITEATQRHLGPSFATRRIATVRVIGINDPVTLYELVKPGQPDWEELKGNYEKALSCFEAQDFRAAAPLLGQLLNQDRFRDDIPSLVLLHRVVTALVTKPKNFSPVWDLVSK